MSASGGSVDQPLRAELLAVADAAADRLRAQTDEDDDAEGAADETLLAAVTSAMGAGHSLGAITGAEARGQEDVRRALGGEALKRVERSGRHAREAETEHHRAIARAMRLGLSTREIALAAGVTHGTIRAISNRLAADTSARGMAEAEPSEPPGDDGSNDGESAA